MLARLEDSVLVVVDMQPTFLDGIWRKEEVLNRARFIVKVARILDVPILATEQYPERMGGTEPTLAAVIDPGPLAKMTFSCCGVDTFPSALDGLGKAQTVLVGIETHICIGQTAHQLLDYDYEVIVCTDAVSARQEDRHQAGIDRLRDLGVTLAHTEAVAYEWMKTADHPRFKEVLDLVKKSAEGG